ncbi:DUF4349 domain-containing protein [Flavobacterium amniphilum]|uniref:DUF4349 domain-containing protein n=1 Tax=Flavobacterium amniphilum TaxID=1834035 RepID=UPI00202A637E|nr:DUF4349 domain-containing protein [Flavobacterium amniphilum]MCL9805841.1 DUF4349 domain-containing protein [Flavobacterium amniphilum]
MKKMHYTGLALLVIATIVYSCKNREYEENVAGESVAEASAATADSTQVVSSLAAVEPEKSNRKFIRTADIKFKVKNVPKSTYIIEDAMNKFGGFVTYTNLQSNVSERDEVKVSPDSSLVTTKYTMVNDITIRVPNTKLDTVIKTIASQIDFLDYRVIKADDVSLKMLSNELAQRRSNSSEQRIEKAIDTKGKKLDNVLNAEDRLDAKKEQHDNSKIENLSLQDQVNFSTLTLAIYQNEAVKQELIANEKSVNAYRPNIGLQIWDSIKTGWFMLEAIIAFVFQLWGILLLGFGAYFLAKRYAKKG